MLNFIRNSGNLIQQIIMSHLGAKSGSANRRPALGAVYFEAYATVYIYRNMNPHYHIIVLRQVI